MAVKFLPEATIWLLVRAQQARLRWKERREAKRHFAEPRTADEVTDVIVKMLRMAPEESLREFVEAVVIRDDPRRVLVLAGRACRTLVPEFREQAAKVRRANIGVVAGTDLEQE